MAIAARAWRRLALGAVLAALAAAPARSGEEAAGAEEALPPPAPPAATPEPLPPRPPAPVRAGPGPLRLDLEFDFRHLKLRPAKVSDKYDDYVGDVHYDRSLDVDRYTGRDVFETAALGLKLHWQVLKSLELYAGLCRPLIGRAEHDDAEYDGAPVAGLDLELDNGATLEAALGAVWESPRLRGGPLRNFGLAAMAEFRAGWADGITSPDEDEFGPGADAEVDYEASWQALDLELRVLRVFPDTMEGVLTVWAGVGTGFLFYHETWDGEFEDGAEEEKMEFDYREEHPLFGSAGVRAEVGRCVAEVSGRYGGQYLVHVSLGWRF